VSKPVLGVIVGTVFGAIDGASAWFSPEAQSMMFPIVVGSTIKGVATGWLAGLIARRCHSLILGLFSGLMIGFALSSLAALEQSDHYLEIVLPGMLVGALVGLITQRYPQRITGTSTAIALIVIVWSTILSAGHQTPTAPDPFQRVAFMLGKWQGEQQGQPGKGVATREYSRVLNSRFIRVVNRSEYPPQEKNPKGEIHQDEGFFSFDRARKKLVLRQFHIEGFFNQYLEDDGATPTSISFTSEALENIPPGWKARETYTVHGPDEFEEVFELAEAGKPYEVYSRVRFKRVK
jgi:hypothetical protein